MENVTQMPFKFQPKTYPAQSPEMRKVINDYMAWTEIAEDRMTDLKAEDKKFHAKLEREGHKLAQQHQDHWTEIFNVAKKEGMIPDEIKTMPECCLELSKDRRSITVAPKKSDGEKLEAILGNLKEIMPGAFDGERGDKLAEILKGKFGQQTDGDEDLGPTIH